MLQNERDLFGNYAPQFNKDRIKQARELAGLTQQELAENIGVQQAWIAKIENGRKPPSFELMAAIARQVQQPVAFFAQDSAHELGDGTLLFRAKANISRKKEIEARRHAEIVLELGLRLSAHFNNIPVSLTPLKEKPVDAAQLVRTQLGLDDVSPIPHLVRAVEKAGVFVLSIPKFDDRYAFAMWGGIEQRTPLMAIADGAPGDQLRFSVAHEIGHLVMHKGAFAGRQVEMEAHEFAAELLAPERGVKSDLMIQKITLDRLGELKLKWGVSIQALLRRSFELSVITERQYRYLLQQVSMRGWRTKEPFEYNIPVEKPRLLRQMAERVYGEPLNYEAIGSDAHLFPGFVKALLERYASSAETQPSELPSNVVRFPNQLAR
jgi:Zn-dependent peptidase ImmA (M78 family)/DNA-binding XRE family transcriptional regulator